MQTKVCFFFVLTPPLGRINCPAKAVFKMKRFPEFREACGVQAVLLGAAFVSGRETAFFFSGAGPYSWLGIGLAAVIFGLLTALLARLARDTQAASLPGIYYAALGVRCGDALCVLHALTMLMTGAAALSTAGEMGALALDDPCASWLFAGMAMLLALIPALNGMRLIGLLGLIAVPACCLFFLAMAMDPRPAAAGAYLTDSLLSSRRFWPLTLTLGILYAFLKSALAGSVAILRGARLRPGRFGLCNSLLLGLTTGLANWAIQSQGPETAELNLPMVVMAARWGVFGFYLAIYLMLLGCAGSLACAIGSLSSLISGRVGRLNRLMLVLSAIALMSAAGLRSLVEVGYPLLGWLSALALTSLALLREKRRRAVKLLPPGKRTG